MTRWQQYDTTIRVLITIYKNTIRLWEISKIFWDHLKMMGARDLALSMFFIASSELCHSGWSPPVILFRCYRILIHNRNAVGVDRDRLPIIRGFTMLWLIFILISLIMAITHRYMTLLAVPGRGEDVIFLYPFRYSASVDSVLSRFPFLSGARSHELSAQQFHLSPALVRSII